MFPYSVHCKEAQMIYCLFHILRSFQCLCHFFRKDISSFHHLCDTKMGKMPNLGNPFCLLHKSYTSFTFFPYPDYKYFLVCYFNSGHFLSHLFQRKDPIIPAVQWTPWLSTVWVFWFSLWFWKRVKNQTKPNLTNTTDSLLVVYKY